MPGTGKYEPKTSRENKTDPNADAAAEEQETLKNHVAASVPANNPGPNTYLEHEKDVSAEVDAQIKRQRGAPHSRK